MGTATRAAKAKVSVTLSVDALHAIDEAVRQGRHASRSAALDDALSEWLRAERRRQRDAEIDAYYDGQTAAEIEEEIDWAGLHHRSMARGNAVDKPGPGKRVVRPQVLRQGTRRALQDV